MLRAGITADADALVQSSVSSSIRTTSEHTALGLGERQRGAPASSMPAERLEYLDWVEIALACCTAVG